MLEDKKTRGLNEDICSIGWQNTEHGNMLVYVSEGYNITFIKATV